MEPYEQNTQQSPGSGCSRDLQWGHSKKTSHTFVGMVSCVLLPQRGHVRVDSRMALLMTASRMFLHGGGIAGVGLRIDQRIGPGFVRVINDGCVVSRSNDYVELLVYAISSGESGVEGG